MLRLGLWDTFIAFECILELSACTAFQHQRHTKHQSHYRRNQSINHFQSTNQSVNEPMIRSMDQQI